MFPVGFFDSPVWFYVLLLILSNDILIPVGARPLNEIVNVTRELHLLFKNELPNTALLLPELPNII